MRLFLAVHPGQQLVDELATRVDRTRQQLDSCRSLRWTRPALSETATGREAPSGTAHPAPAE